MTRDYGNDPYDRRDDRRDDRREDPYMRRDDLPPRYCGGEGVRGRVVVMVVKGGEERGKLERRRGGV